MLIKIMIMNINWSNLMNFIISSTKKHYMDLIYYMVLYLGSIPILTGLGSKIEQDVWNKYKALILHSYTFLIYLLTLCKLF